MTFCFSDPATVEIYTLSLHDALPISRSGAAPSTPPSTRAGRPGAFRARFLRGRLQGDRKSTRLNSSHLGISYAVFCLKKKNRNLDAASVTQSELVRAQRRCAA